VIEDCNQALHQNPKNLKAHLRLTKANNSLHRYEEALRAASEGLKIDCENKELQAESSKAKSEVDKKQKKEEETKVKTMALQTMKKKIEERRYRLGKPTQEMASEYVSLSSFDEQNDEILFPVLFLYPESGKSEIVARFREDLTFLEQLSVMLPPQAPPLEWDHQLRYKINTIILVYQSIPLDPYAAPKWKKISLVKKLREVLSLEDYVIPGVPTFYVLVPGSFADHFFSST